MRLWRASLTLPALFAFSMNSHEATDTGAPALPAPALGGRCASARSRLDPLTRMPRLRHPVTIRRANNGQPGG